MRYLRHIARSPRLTLQLLLTLVVAGLIGGTGLIGLATARNAATYTSNIRMPALVHLLDAQRDIAQANYYGAMLVVDLKDEKSGRARAPKIQALASAAADSFKAYRSERPSLATNTKLEARVATLFDRWVAMSSLSKQLASSDIGATIVAQGMNTADSTVVTPLMQSLTQLVQADVADAGARGRDVARQTQTASWILIAVIVLAMAIAGGFQVGLGVREHRRHVLVRESADLVVLLNAQGTIIFASPAWKRLLSHTDPDFMGRDILDLIHPVDREGVRELLAHALQDQPRVEEFECRVRHADGTYRWLASLAVNELRDPLIQGVVLKSRDVTQRHEAEAALRASEARLRAAISHAPIAIFATDGQGMITFYEGGPLFRDRDAGEPEVGKLVTDVWIANAAATAALWKRATTGETFSALYEGIEQIVELWWIPEIDASGKFSGGTGVATIVTETVRAQREAEQARAAAVELAELRNGFVASVSHELRTPLTSIIGYGELLQAHWDRLEEGQRKERLNRIVASANRQKRLVEDLLVLSRLDDARETPRQQSVGLAQLARSVTTEIQGTYPGQQFHLLGPEELYARADADRMTQVLANLVDNAAKYSPEGSPIHVTWSLDGDTAVVRVRDAGPGIPETSLVHLFTRFGRIPGSPIRSGHVGTGLGLYLGKQLAIAMGGELDLESTGIGGSTFRLRLPVAPADSAATEARD